MKTNMTKDELLDRLHYVSGVLAHLVLDGKIEAAQEWAKEVAELSARLNQVIPS